MCRCNFRSWRADVMCVCVPNRNLQGPACNPFAWPWGARTRLRRCDDALGSLAGRLPFGQAPRAEATALSSCPSLFASKEACHVVSVP